MITNTYYNKDIDGIVVADIYSIDADDLIIQRLCLAKDAIAEIKTSATSMQDVKNIISKLDRNLQTLRKPADKTGHEYEPFDCNASFGTLRNSCNSQTVIF